MLKENYLARVIRAKLTQIDNKNKVYKLISTANKLYKEGEFKAAIIELNKAQRLPTTVDQLVEINNLLLEIANKQYEIKIHD